MRSFLLLCSVLSFPLFADTKHITILGTNDIHGGVEAATDKDGAPMGGMTHWSGVVKAIRAGVSQKYGVHGGVLLVDGGDQFQGTLVSNYTEGKLVFDIMNQMGYDAAIPGNHDYDFGPVGWLVDQSTDPLKRREVIERLSQSAKFALLSANTFYRKSLKAGNFEILSNYCKAKGEGVAVDYSSAEQPKFLKPFLIKNVAGIRVAIIGIDHPKTRDVTTQANVEDLCFDDEVAAYRRTRKQLEGKADIFLLVIHQGNTKADKPMLSMVGELTKNGREVDAVVSGHTHFSLNESINGVPIIQSGSGGTQFGRIDLVWDTALHKLRPELTKSWAGVRLYHAKCDDFAKEYCEVVDGVPRYEGVSVKNDEVVENILRSAKREVAPLAERVLGEVLHDHPKDRISENLAGNLFSDLLRAITQTDISMINMGGIREGMKKGTLTYEKLFRIFPFSNHAFVIGPISAKALLSVIERNIKTCGAIGTIIPSGVKVTYERHCESAVNGEDKNAKLLSVEMLDGRKLYGEGVSQVPELVFSLTTLDYLYSGGEGNTELSVLPLVSDEGILRERMTEFLLDKKMNFQAVIDGRWKNVTP